MAMPANRPGAPQPATNAQDAMPEGGKLAIQTQNLVLGPELPAAHGYVSGPHGS